LEEARILFREKSLRGTINRAYYSMFYAVLALLSTQKLGTSKHSGVLSLFDREFIKKGIFSKEFSKFLRKAFNLRQSHDYGEFIEIEKINVKEILERSDKFIKEIIKFLQSNNYLDN